MRKRLQNGELLLASSAHTLPGHWLGYIWEGAIDLPACHLAAKESTSAARARSPRAPPPSRDGAPDPTGFYLCSTIHEAEVLS